jgi:hypothetical protein
MRLTVSLLVAILIAELPAGEAERLRLEILGSIKISLLFISWNKGPRALLSIRPEAALEIMQIWRVSD